MKKLKWLFRIFIIGSLFNGAILIIYLLYTKNSLAQLSTFLMVATAIEFILAFLCLSNPSDELSRSKRNMFNDSFGFMNRSLMGKYISDSENCNFIVFQIFSVFGVVGILYLFIITKLS
ncbi:hypothetical protein SAMN02745163_03185 [Clostridium cavendishii DSM 21758]|uniref:Uncharacterized protein n=1 Tax=Clostridium cavendishii DSM 21758 TaxID=1121302 RepID=A0A1M6PKQ2_9CLOT|nr:hypothetical protein [Clostridium cavendishii]SHK08488.1 hypothetical protein SAMN02745163_03185 [Clostridium cavendishii DSM 21758]